MIFESIGGKMCHKVSVALLYRTGLELTAIQACIFPGDQGTGIVPQLLQEVNSNPTQHILVFKTSTHSTLTVCVY